jgi:hypothetical protein
MRISISRVIPAVEMAAVRLRSVVTSVALAVAATLNLRVFTTEPADSLALSETQSIHWISPYFEASDYLVSQTDYVADKDITYTLP